MCLRGNISSNLSLKKRGETEKETDREKRNKKEEEKKLPAIAFKFIFGVTFGECTKKSVGAFFPLVNSRFFL